MKKFFTLIAAALMAAGANAQTLSFDQEVAAGSAKELELGDSNFKVVLNGGANAKVQQKSLTFALEGATSDAERETFAYQYCPGGGVKKLSGERSITITVSKAGALTVYPRSGGSDDRDFLVVQNGNTLLTATGYNAAQVTIGDKQYYKAYKVNVAAGTINITCENQVNFSAFKFEASEEEPGDEPGEEPATETTVVASWNVGTVDGGTWTLFNAESVKDSNKSILEGYTGKYNENKTLTPCITFCSGIVSGGEWVSYVKVEADFKTGDVVTMQPFTSMSTSDFTGGSKYANLVIYNSEKKMLYTTGGTAESKTVTDGHEEAGDPKEFTYTLENDMSEIYFGRQGGTRLNVMKIVISRKNVSTGINTVDATVNNGKWYNLQGQEVAAPTKGLFIKDGKKYVIK